MLVVVVAVLLVANAIVWLAGRAKNNEERKHEQQVLAAFDNEIEKLTGTTFQERSIIKEEKIKDYGLYVETRYQELQEENQFFSELSYFTDYDETEKKQILDGYRQRIAALQEEGASSAAELRKVRDRYYWLSGVASGHPSDLFTQQLSDRIVEVRDSLSLFSVNSPGIRYIIDGVVNDTTVCRFVFVAPEDDVTSLTMCGGRVYNPQKEN